MKIKAADYPERLLLRYREEDLPKLSNELEKEADKKAFYDFINGGWQEESK